MAQINPSVMSLASALAELLAFAGAEAVVLTGSHVRGAAHPESDLDLVAIGEGSPYTLTREAGRLVATTWVPAETIRSGFERLPDAVDTVPGWRDAVILYDPKGTAASLKEAAEAWTWSSVAHLVNEWVAREITGYAEEIHKLVSNLERGRHTVAAVQRSVLALHMAPILAVHFRLLCDTEDQRWDIVSDVMGDRWTAVQTQALALRGESFAKSCAAALTLYLLAADRVHTLLSDEQEAVVDYAARLALSMIETLGE